MHRLPSRGGRWYVRNVTATRCLLLTVADRGKVRWTYNLPTTHATMEQNPWIIHASTDKTVFLLLLLSVNPFPSFGIFIHFKRQLLNYKTFARNVFVHRKYNLSLFSDEIYWSYVMRWILDSFCFTLSVLLKLNYLCCI